MKVPISSISCCLLFDKVSSYKVLTDTPFPYASTDLEIHS